MAESLPAAVLCSYAAESGREQPCQHPPGMRAVGDGLYLNPAEPAAADYVVQGVAELLQNARWTASTLTIIFTLRPKKASMRRSLRPAVRQTLQHGDGRT